MAAQLQVVTGIATTLIALIAGLTLSFERLGSRLAAIVRMTARTLAGGHGRAVGRRRGWSWPWLPIAPDAVGSAAAGHAGLAGRDRRLVLADDDGGGGRRFGRARPPQRHGAGDGRARRPRDAGAVLGVDAAGARRVRRRRRRRAWRCWRDWRGRSAARSPLASSSACCSRSICATSAVKSRWCCWRCAPCSVRSARRSSSSRCWPPLAAGVVIENLAVAQGDTLRAAVRRGAPPVLVVFFVAVGASLRLDARGRHRLQRARACPRSDSDSSGWASSAGVRLVRACPSRSASMRGPGWCRRPASPSGLPRSSPPSFPGGATSCSCCWWRRLRFTSWSGPILFRRGLAAGRRARRARAAPAGRRVEPRAVPAQPATRTAASSVKAATGGVAVALDALMRERGGVWIAHGAGPADRLVVDASRQGAGASRAVRRTRCGGCGSRSRRSPPTTAALPTRACGRCATWSTSGRSFAAKTGPRTRTSTRASPPRFTRSSARPTRRSSSRTITWRSWRRRCGPCGPTPAPRSSGTSPGPIRIGCASARGGASWSPGCSPTT